MIIYIGALETFCHTGEGAGGGEPFPQISFVAQIFLGGAGTAEPPLPLLRPARPWLYTKMYNYKLSRFSKY